MSNRTIDKANISDFELGKILFRRGITFESCTNDRMRDGWNVAENNTAWGIYDDSPEDAVRFEYSQPWNAASAGVYPGKAITPKRNSRAYSNEYHYHGVDYPEPSL